MDVAGVDALQHEWELDQIVQLYRRFAPSRVLEIGAWEGGTLWHWLQQRGVAVTVIDTEVRDLALWDQWATDAGSDLAVLPGRCEDPEIVAAARDLGPYGWVFLDADHTHEAARRDWENYSPMVAPGGAFVFHDIRRYEHGTLDVFWDELKQGRRTLEFHDRRGADWGGIGVVLT